MSLKIDTSEPDICAFTRHIGQGMLPEKWLELTYCFKHLRQKECKQGKLLGWSKIAKHKEHLMKSPGSECWPWTLAMVDLVSLVSLWRRKDKDDVSKGRRIRVRCSTFVENVILLIWLKQHYIPLIRISISMGFTLQRVVVFSFRKYAIWN